MVSYATPWWLWRESRILYFFTETSYPENLPCLFICRDLYITRLWVAGPLCGTMPQAGFNPPSAEMQTSTECEFDAITLQATTAGLTST